MTRGGCLRQETSAIPAQLHCIHEIFQRNALDQPNAPAVCSWDGNLTYRELDERSSALARMLRYKGVAENVFVALCFDRSLWTAVAMLGVSKAGGVWLFLEPEHPVNRLKDMLRAVNVTLVLSGASQSDLAAQLCEHGVQTMLVSEFTVNTSSAPDLELGTVRPSQPAYVAFTSGSTGKPKGALMTHQAAVSGVLLNNKPMHIGKDSRVLHFASFAFDISFLEHLWALIGGGCLCIPSEADRKSDLIHTIQKLQANWTFMTPTVARLLDPTELSSLEYLCLGGEPVTQRDLEMWLPHVHLCGLYGPAECCVGIAVQSDYRQVNHCSDVGFSYSVTPWIVDENDLTRLVPPGYIGELIVEGPSISEFYVNDPGQTEKAYISNPPWLPASRCSKKRLYRTGDLATFQPDGSVRLFGRKDTQVKVNGQRIELQDIEYHTQDILSSDDIRPQVIVDAITVNGRSPSIIAFHVVERKDNPSSATDLFFLADEHHGRQKDAYKAQLRKRLPHYMVPDTFVPIRDIPLTISGKSDRKVLRERFSQLPKAQVKAYFLSDVSDMRKESPATKLESQMLQLWANVLMLPVEEIGPCKSWISLGGDSLAAMRLVMLARKARIMMTLSDIFRYQTISTLCQHVSSEIFESTDEIKPFSMLGDLEMTAKEISQAAADQCRTSCDLIEDVYPLTALQDATVLPPIQLGYNYTLRLEFKLQSKLDLDRLSRAWEMTVAFNPVLRMRIVQLPNDALVQVITREKAKMELLDSPQASSYQSGADIWGLGKPLLRVAAGDNKLIMLIHHALYDGHSLGLIFRDLAHTYEGGNLEMVEYAPFVKWSTDLTDAKRQYWTKKFVGFDGRVCPPRVDDESIDYHESQHIWADINLVHDEYTATNKLRVAFAIVLYSYFHTSDVVFGAVMARRAAPLPNILNSPIPTSSILPDRICLEPSKSLRFNLELDRENMLAMMEFEGIRPCQAAALSVEGMAAGKYQSILAVQPDNTSTYPEMFRDHQMGYHGPVAAWNIMLQCYLRKGSVHASLRLSERTMNLKDKIDWKQFLAMFTAVVDSIQSDSSVAISDMLSRLKY